MSADKIILVDINEIAPLAFDLCKELNNVLKKHNDLLKTQNVGLCYKISEDIDGSIRVDITYDITCVKLTGEIPSRPGVSQLEFLEYP
jgi:hypothetical protein